MTINDGRHSLAGRRLADDEGIREPQSSAAPVPSGGHPPGLPTAPGLHIAIEEAAHGTIAHALGLPVGVLSTRPAEAHAGVTLLDAEPWAGPWLMPGKLPHEQPPEARARVERLCLVFLAGPEAAAMVSTPASGRSEPPPERLPLERLGLAPRAAELLAAAEAQPADDDIFAGDEHEASIRALAICGGDAVVAGVYLEALRAMARQLVKQHAAAIAAVASALQARGYLSGAECVALIDTGTPPAK